MFSDKKMSNRAPLKKFKKKKIPLKKTGLGKIKK